MYSYIIHSIYVRIDRGKEKIPDGWNLKTWQIEPDLSIAPPHNEALYEISSSTIDPTTLPGPSAHGVTRLG